MKQKKVPRHDDNSQHSLQAMLFARLKPEQQEFVRTVLRVMKKTAQAKLCSMLLDYLEGNGNQPACNPVLDALCLSVIEVCELRQLRSPEYV